MKKPLLVIILIALCAVIASGIISRKAPDYIISLLEEELNKDISVESVKYQFPSTFHIQNLAINNRQTFKGENSFFVESLKASLQPLMLLKKKVIFDEIIADKPQITLRKQKGVVYHAFEPDHSRDTLVSQEHDMTSTYEGKDEAVVEEPKDEVYVEVKKLKINQGVLRFIDYDVGSEGYAIVAHSLGVDAKNITNIVDRKPIEYTVSGLVSQGREVEPINLSVSGWYRSDNHDLNSNIQMSNVWIPYFQPYYIKITPSVINDGVIDLKSTTVIENLDWTTNARMNIRRLQFSQFESGNEILGFNAESILNILRDNSGQIALDLIIRWDMKDPNVSFEDALRKSFRHSMKSTFLLNIETVVENTLEKISEEGADFINQDWKNIIKDDNIEGLVGDLLDVVE